MGRNIIRKKKRETSKFTITLDFKLESHREGSATYFREYLRDYKKWVDENKKPDGSDYDIYKDGLKIYTTIDSRMQHAEEAVSAHMANLQEEFFIQAKNKKRSICRHLRQRNAAHFDQCNESIKPMVCLKSADKSDEEIIKSFSVKQNDRIYMERRKDTIMTPMDSIRYYKHFLQSGLMAMEPQTGNIKAWVGGIDYV
jgi:penicillin-binding protein 1A